MKNSLPILMLALIVGFRANATGVIKVPTARTALASKVYEWSFGALSKTMKDMRIDCEKTNGDEFIEIGNWARSKNGFFSVAELISKCQSILQFEKLFRGERNSSGIEKLCKYPDASSCIYNMNPRIPTECGEKPWTKPTQYGTRNWGCDIFISTFIKNNNEIAAKGLRSPGTYVQRVGDTTHGPTYQVIDVILSDDYYIKDSSGTPIDVNFDANTANQNTIIYEVFESGLITNLIGTNGEMLHTWTNDMFLDVRASSNRMGDMAGVAVNSFIMPKQDISYRIYDIYNTNRGLWGASVTNAINSMPKNPYDIKTTLGPEFRVPKFQSPNTSDQYGNGLVFNGKVATIDWLGNLLYSMNSNETQYGAPQRWFSRILADGVSSYTTFKEDGNLSREPVTVRQAFQIGNNIVADLKNQRDERFKDVSTAVESDAYAKAKRVMETSIANGGYGAHNVVCTGNCRPQIRLGIIIEVGADDIVSCTGYDVNNTFFVQDFVFNDICDDRVIKQNSMGGNTVSSYPNGQATQR